MFQHRRRFSAIALSVGTALALSHPARAQNAQAGTPADPTAAAHQPGQQNQQQRAQILKEAQARVLARRRLREQQVEQETYSHKFEVYAGGGYLRFRPGSSLQHNTEGAWNAGLTEWIRPKLGLTADFRGYYGTAVTNNFEFQVFKPSVSQYTFLFGPQYRYFQNQHWALHAQVLAGAAHGNFSTGLGSLRGAPVGLYPDGTVFALEAGAPVDYNLGSTLALRLTPNYLFTRFGSEFQQNLGFTAGVVFRWGRQ